MRELKETEKKGIMKCTVSTGAHIPFLFYFLYVINVFFVIINDKNYN